jgi:lambda family phage portal protein
MAMREMVEAGEVLIRMVSVDRRFRGIYRPVPLALEIIEADRLAEEKDTYNIPLRDGHRVKRGVEFDELGRPIAYWIYPNHPTDPFVLRGDPRRIDADEIIHLFNRQRIGQTRGISMFAPVVSWLRDLGVYVENELQASAVASCFTVAIKTEGGMSGLGPPSTANGNTTDSDGNRYEYLQPGMIMHLSPNESIESANPGRPNSASEPWIRLMLRGIAVGTGLSYETVARDYSQTSYSSNRASQLEDRRRFRRLQRYLIEKLNQRVWNKFCMAAALIDLNGFPTAAEMLANPNAAPCDHMPPSWEWVDPQAEQTSSELSIKAFQTTYADELGAKGLNWRHVFYQRAKEERLLKSLGLVSPTAISGLPVSQAEQQAQQAAQPQPDAGGTESPASAGNAPPGQAAAPEAQQVEQALSATGEMMGLSRLQWQRNRKAIMDVINDLTSSAISNAQAVVLLSGLGLKRETIEYLIEDVNQDIPRQQEEQPTVVTPVEDESKKKDERAFCPTGKEGGIDNTCPPNAGSIGTGAPPPRSIYDLSENYSLGGSTGAMLAEDDEGNKWVVKQGSNPKHIQSEAAANKLYGAMGVPVPPSYIYHEKTGTKAGTYQVAEHIDGIELGKLPKPQQEAAIKKLKENFAADALVANWDVVGMNKDNILVTVDGTPVRIDNGGSLEYRAQGGVKAFTSDVPEIDSMRKHNKSVFGDLTDQEVAVQINTLYGKKDSIVAAAPNNLKDTIGKRLDSMKAWAGKVSDVPTASVPAAPLTATPASTESKPKSEAKAKVPAGTPQKITKNDIKVGQNLTIQKYNSNTVHEGEVVSIEDKPKGLKVITYKDASGKEKKIQIGGAAQVHLVGLSQAAADPAAASAAVTEKLTKVSKAAKEKAAKIPGAGKHPVVNGINTGPVNPVPPAPEPFKHGESDLHRTKVTNEVEEYAKQLDKTHGSGPYKSRPTAWADTTMPYPKPTDSQTAVVNGSKGAKDAIRDYSGSAYAGINAKLRRNTLNEMTPQQKKSIVALDAVTRVKLEKPVTVMRGVSSRLLSYDLMHTEVGKSIVDKGFGSTTNDFDTASGFSGGRGGVLMKVNTRYGVPIKSFSLHAHENEVLMPRNMRYTIKKKSWQKVQGDWKMVIEADADLADGGD